jgi:hypothetical protein
MLLTAPLFILTGLLLVLISVPLMRRQIGRGSVGLRTDKTLSSDAVWYPANEYAGKWMFGMGVVQLAIAIWTLSVPFVRDNFVLYAGVNTIILLVGTITMSLVSVAYSEKL